MTRPGRWLAPIGLFTVALLVRLLPWTTVYEGARTFFMGNDAYYHMRRVRFGLRQFPDWLDFDPYLNFPAGARPIWPPLFDGLATLFVMPFDAVGGLPAAERAAALIPALMGAACVVTLYFAARRVFGEAAALITGAMLSVLAAHAWYSQVGFLDHHAATAWCAAIMLWAAIRWMAPGAPRRNASLALSASQAAALLLWPGMLLHLALVEAGVMLQALRRAGSEEGAERFAQRAWGHLLAFALVAPFCLGQIWPQWGEYSANVLSRFQPWLFALLAAHAALSAAFCRARPELRAGRRTTGVLLIALGAVGMSALLLPGLLESVTDAWRWLGKQETFQSRVIESRGMLDTRVGTSTWLLQRNLSVFALLLPLMAVALLWQARREPDRDARWLVALWSVGLLLAALQQRRFGNSAALGVALVSGWAVYHCWVLAGSRRGRGAFRAALVLATGLALTPTLRAHDGPMRRTLAYLSGEPMRLDAYQQSRRNLLEAASWLRERGGGDLASRAAPPDHAVMAPWHLGHRLLYATGLPMVVGNFGDDLGPANFALHRRYMHGDEETAVQQLDRVGARFVVIESLNETPAELLGARKLYRRLNQGPLSNLGSHRLRYVTPLRPRSQRTRSYRIFERVSGVQVTGRAEPGVSVEARMLVRGGEVGIRLKNETTADDSGRYRLQLAQASGDAVRDGWQLRAGENAGTVAVTVEDLAGEQTLSGPDLR